MLPAVLFGLLALSSLPVAPGTPQWACNGSPKQCSDETACSPNGARTVFCCNNPDGGGTCYDYRPFNVDCFDTYDQYRIDDSACTEEVAGPKPSTSCTAVNWTWLCADMLTEDTFGPEGTEFTQANCELPCAELKLQNQSKYFDCEAADGGFEFNCSWVSRRRFQSNLTKKEAKCLAFTECAWVGKYKQLFLPERCVAVPASITSFTAGRYKLTYTDSDSNTVTAASKIAAAAASRCGCRPEHCPTFDRNRDDPSIYGRGEYEGNNPQVSSGAGQLSAALAFAVLAMAPQ